MKIAGTEINLQHRALEIYVSGCRPPHCKGCHNPELWSFDVGVDCDSEELAKLTNKLRALKDAKLVDYVWVLGGEPQDQKEAELAALFRELSTVAPTMLWTSYEEVKPALLPYVTYAKLGPYVKDGEPYVEPMFIIKLANKEQRVVCLKEASSE